MPRLPSFLLVIPEGAHRPPRPPEPPTYEETGPPEGAAPRPRRERIQLDRRAGLGAAAFAGSSAQAAGAAAPLALGPRGISVLPAWMTQARETVHTMVDVGPSTEELRAVDDEGKLDAFMDNL